MKKILMTAAAACVAFAGAASAASISISAFDIGSFNSATNYSGFVVEDFENIGLPAGQLAGPLDTNTVGTFSALSGQGSGSTCAASGGDCTQLFLNDGEDNGQDNSVPLGGQWSLNANDTYGVSWAVEKEQGGSMFNRIVFALMDAADIGNTVVRVSVGNDFAELSGLQNAEQKLIVIDFGSLVDTALVEIASSRVDDSFSIDGASVGVVPLPAGGLLLLTGLGAFGVYRRRKQAA